MTEVILRGDKKCPHGLTSRGACQTCDNEDDLDEAYKERDWAQDRLQATHIALGGDGEWSGKLPPQEPPQSGDLHYDVPALAGERMVELERLRAFKAAIFSGCTNEMYNGLHPHDLWDSIVEQAALALLPQECPKCRSDDLHSASLNGEEAISCCACDWIATRESFLCDDCPPVGYPTDQTRCKPCPRRDTGDQMDT